MKHCKPILVAIALLCAVWGNAQNDCADAIVVCGNTGFQGLTATGSGISELNSNNSCSGVETNTIWLKLPIKTGGTLGFTLVPESTDIFEDFDFYIFGPNVTCGALGNAIRCSTTNPDNAGLPDNLTGMNSFETDVSEGPGFDGNSFVNWLTVNSGDTYYIVIDRPFGQSNFSLQWTGTAVFEGLPDLPSVGTSLDLEECDHDSVDDASTAFDLTQDNAAILGAQTEVTLSYHTNSNDVLTGDNPIPDPSNFTNTVNPQPIFVRVVNTITGCFDQMEFSVQVNNSIHIPNDTFTLCDDGADGDGTNGKTNFNLNDVTDAIFGGAQNAAGLTTKYYSSQFNALNDIGAFLNTSFYNTVANQQVIYVWATDPVGGCSNIKAITLNVIAQPIATSTTLVQCDTSLNPDGITTFNLNAAIPALTGNNPALGIAFFENGNPNPLSGNYTNLTNPQSLTAEVTNLSTGCKNTATLTLIVNVSPAQPVTIAPQCDILNSENGIGSFDLSTSDLVLLPGQTAVFYENENDALLEQNAITNTASYPNANPYVSTIYVRVQDNSGCFSINEMTLVVHKLPNVIREETGLFVCDDNPGYHIMLDAAILEGVPSDYTYEWFLDGISLSLQTYQIEVNVAGTYIVEVSRNGCTIKRTIIVSDSGNANIDSILVDDFVTDTNTITINITGTSLGSYVYALDHPDTVYQESNVFGNVTPGFHELYIKDLYACGIFGPVPINVLGVPRYFTPNGDGFNDTWNMKGAEAASNKNSTIYIFDRYGKLLTRISPVGPGWDGTFSDKPLPADDYWYTISLDNGRNTKGHFSLKR